MRVDIPDTPVFMRVLKTFIKIYGDLRKPASHNDS